MLIEFLTVKMNFSYYIYISIMKVYNMLLITIYTLYKIMTNKRFNILIGVNIIYKGSLGLKVKNFF